jgi:hypothetical protein
MVGHRNGVKAQQLLGPATPDLVAFGRLLRTAREHGEFEQFCDALHVHTRKAYDLITIADAVDAGLLTPGAVQEIGWSKARVIASHACTKHESRRAVLFARGNTLPALVSYFQSGSSAESLVTKCFNLTTKEEQELEATLRLAGGRMRGGRMLNRAEALMIILRAYRHPVRARRSSARQ